MTLHKKVTGEGVAASGRSRRALPGWYTPSSRILGVWLGRCNVWLSEAITENPVAIGAGGWKSGVGCFWLLCLPRNPTCCVHDAATAKAAAAAVEQYTRRIWRVQDGFPEDTVQAIQQSPDGYLWIGTTGGLVRFDGSHFLLYDHATTPALADNSVFCILSARDGSLWIGTDGGGLVHFKDGDLPRLYPNRGFNQRLRTQPDGG